MKDKNFWLHLIEIFIIISLFIWLFLNSKPKEDNNILIEKIEKLELQIESLQSQKDSIRTVIDSTHIKIVTNEKHYQEVVNTIISQPTTSDYEFIRGCIRQYRSQNDSLNLR